VGPGYVAQGGTRDTVTLALENSGTGLQATPATARAMARIEAVVGAENSRRCD